MLTLYFTPGASSMAPHIALHEVGAHFESQHISLAKKEHRSPAYLAINPEGKVPTLLIDGRQLTEVAGILFYLAKRYPDANLVPTGDIEAEAQAISWMSFIAATVHPARALAQVRGLDHAMAIYKLADQRLGNARMGPRLLLNRRYPPVPSLLALSPTPLSRAPGSFPNLEAHYSRMMARPAVRRTIEIEQAIGYDLP